MSAEQEILFRHCRLDTVNQLLWRGSRVIPLRQKSFAVLRHLLEHAGQLATKEELLRAVWPETYVSDIVLKVCIRELRHALGDQREAPQFIETVHRRGYRFIAPLSTSPQPVRSPKSKVPSQEKARGWKQEISPPSPQVSSLKPLASSMVGREEELAQFHRWLEKALNGERQVVFVTGEPGIGKTTLVEAFLDHAVVNPTLWTARGQCIEHYGAGEAYLPVLEALERLCRTPGRERLITLLSQYVPMWLAQMPSLVGPTERKRLLREVQGASRERMLRAIAETVEALTAETPLILVLEDLHWSDYATLDLLSFLARRREPARLLLIGTYRPGEMIDHSHPLKTIKYELQAHGQCGELALNCLTPAAVSTYMTARFGGGTRLPLPKLAELIHQCTDGNPLFLITVVDYLLAQGLIGQRDGRWELRGDLAAIEIGVPASIQEMIETQIDRLSQEEQRVLEVASVAGVEFSAATVAAGLEAEVTEVEERCEGLVRRAQFLRSRGVSEWPDGTVAARYEFIHSLYQQAWYERVTAGRRVQLHRRIGERAEVAYGSRASEVAAELAMHFERGRDYQRAIQYRLYAAENALRRGGYLEAVKHLTGGLERLPTLPDTPERIQQEISLRISLGLSLVATKGCAAPEVEKNYSRALDLCRQVEATPQLYWALWGLQGFYYVGAELQTARALGEQLVELAQRLQDPGLLGSAHTVLGATLSSLGEPLPARAHLEQGIALCSTQRHARLQAICLSFTGRVLWTLGYPDQARQRIQEALTLAHELAHPLTSVVTACIAALLHIARGEVQAAQERAEEAMALAVERGFIHWEAQAIALQGWALAQQGRGEESVAQIRQGLAAYQETGAQLARPMLLGLLAETYRNTGRPEESLTVATEALALARHTGQASQEAWLSRLRGELLLQAKVQNPKSKVDNPHSAIRFGLDLPLAMQSEAEACFQRALDLARRQSAKALELRTAMSLSRLWHQQGKTQDARQMLAEIYGWFTEGFDTADLQEAKVLLEELKH